MFNPFSWLFNLVFGMAGIDESEPEEGRCELQGAVPIPIAKIIEEVGEPLLPQDIDIVPEPLTIEEVAARLQETPDPVERPVLKKSRHPRTGHLANIVTQHS